MDCILVGPGRAGLALALHLVESGHRVVGVLARRESDALAAADRLGSIALAWDEPLPAADLLVIAVRDDAISSVAGRLAPHSGAVDAAVHMSGLTSIQVLDVFDGPMIGAFHPLQTLPTPELGAARLEGAWVGITARENYLADRLFEFAESLGMHGFELDDDAKAVYHAAAAAAANFSLTAFALAEELFAAAGVPFEAAGPLIRAVIENALEIGPRRALTGPIARGDVGTVAAQVAAVRDEVPHLAADFAALARVTAVVAGTDEEIEGALE